MVYSPETTPIPADPMVPPGNLPERDIPAHQTPNRLPEHDVQSADRKRGAEDQDQRNRTDPEPEIPERKNEPDMKMPPDSKQDQHKHM